MTSRFLSLVAGTLALVSLAGSLQAQDTIVGNHRIAGPTATRTYTFPDADSRLAVAAGATAFKFATGTVTLDGTNPSSATTGLTAIATCYVTNKRTTAPGLEPGVFTINTSTVAGRLDVYAWAPTSATAPALIASADADDVLDWVCLGS